jgi:hypothetical protein
MKAPFASAPRRRADVERNQLEQDRQQQEAAWKGKYGQARYRLGNVDELFIRRCSASFSRKPEPRLANNIARSPVSRISFHR